jgi:hypothetical protein
MNEWTHIAAKYDGALARLYLNGVQVGMHVRPSLEPFNTNDPLTLGYAGHASYFTGNMEGVFVYDKTLSLAEIKKCMEETRPSFLN